MTKGGFIFCFIFLLYLKGILAIDEYIYNEKPPISTLSRLSVQRDVKNTSINQTNYGYDDGESMVLKTILKLRSELRKDFENSSVQGSITSEVRALYSSAQCPSVTLTFLVFPLVVRYLW
ncbi:unnamed protein product [Bursaphelenchus okinawaensis]|uniref:Uncharacterized protein n=1 Tax=Bursaphelenchus okinawaensis TaxID=465554 RepID=A0A811KZR6_9BILA|nr:unnamed protein product [Bursaphelenchus okinawaensis]CAG9113600.1 unnamed protein product [Bursaphelenchus okinawaensis]